MKFHYQVSFLVAGAGGQTSYHDRTVTCDRPLSIDTIGQFRDDLFANATGRRKGGSLVILNIFQLHPAQQ